MTTKDKNSELAQVKSQINSLLDYLTDLHSIKVKRRITAARIHLLYELALDMPKDTAKRRLKKYVDRELPINFRDYGISSDVAYHLKKLVED